MHLVGHVAPLFDAPAYNPNTNEHETVSLGALKGKWVVLFFYPLDFSKVCPVELNELNDHKKNFDSMDCEVLTISIDSPYSHEAWVEKTLKGFSLKMLSDLTKRISRDYGVLHEERGVSLRATFIIDPEGVVQHHLCNNLSTTRSTTELLATLKRLQNK
jgi:peroxiredoxin (alkyl hydroperoxide reductase subunit C)